MKYFNKITKLKIDKYDFSDFKIEWTYNIGIEDSVAELEIKLFNLSNSTIDNIKKGNQIKFEFGYENEATEFFDGILDSYVVENGITKIITIKAYEYSKDVFKKISRSYIKKTSAQYVIEDICNQCAFILKKCELKNNIIFNHGYNVYDMPIIALKKVVKSSGSQIKIDGDKIYIYSKTLGTNTGIEFDYTSGLLTEPNTIQSSVASEIEEDNDKEKKEKYKLPASTHMITTLANPNVKKFDLIKVLGEIYRVDSINIDEWRTEMEVSWIK